MLRPQQSRFVDVSRSMWLLHPCFREGDIGHRGGGRQDPCVRGVVVSEPSVVGTLVETLHRSSVDDEFSRSGKATVCALF